jgi:isoquinoline 1-oxidoreductase beta subunit
VYNTQNPIASECFLDEISGALKRDPFEFKRDLLPADSRKRYVLEKVAEISDWKNPLPAGWGKGIACHFCFGSFAATVVYASALNNKIKIEKVFSVVDCGQVVNRNSATSQIEGGIIFGLSAAMKSRITIDKGRVVQNNFDGYEVLLYDETPEITVYIKDSNDAPGGIGEPPVPPAIAACVSAVSDAVGKRIRKLPILNK